ncbi:flagellar biosynthetic protein FliR [Noviherbaspirillum autotrophicum]|uniref:Flagellar biosynthetic protein FliR n=1 Tax=Noviherbaspirillum autotrophicum TaxID=709839 RepID=A0A0C2BPZ5_9BURK|nr:flagellar biosynthetic protein FliR [Noviherbaspirillum autotrophicum]KIF82154.1 flagellar biosynthesis protein FliR [Noviherbaspirillum autotrophicum]
MLSFTSTELNTWIASFLWPLTRILGLVSVAPLFGNVSVPARVKLGLGVMLAMVIAPTVPAVSAMAPMSLQGLLILVQQLVIGLSMGFAMRTVFAGIEMAGEISSMTMGLGFATFYDPQSRGHSSAISQFLALLTLMIYLATDLHLVLLSTLAQSFSSLPISTGALSSAGFLQVVSWGARIFSAGVQLSLPIVAALLITNMALGILTRAAPQLNIFGIGFPITIGVGFSMIAVTLPYLATPIGHVLHEGIDAIQQITALMAPKAN